MHISSVGASPSAPRPASEPRPEPAVDKKAETPAVARSEDQATPPPKKAENSPGATLDISA